MSASERRNRVEESMRRARVDDMANRHCSKLSKGYRQRVGLAQAILHNPEVLILDEPTAGLDPKQIIETRQLIKELAGKHTIILSTHILPEVAADLRPGRHHQQGPRGSHRHAGQPDRTPARIGDDVRRRWTRQATTRLPSSSLDSRCHERGRPSIRRARRPASR